MNFPRPSYPIFLGLISFSSLAQSQTVLNTAADGTYFEVSAGDRRVNNDVVRVGANDAVSFEFVGLLFFDVSGFTPAQLNSATSLTLDYELAVQDNSPPLDDIAFDYVGTFASNDLGANGVNNASSNAIAIGNAPVVTSLFSGPETLGTTKSLDVTAISSDTFDNRYAVFRITEPTLAGHQWDIPDGEATLTVTLAPEPTRLGIDFGPQQTAGWNNVTSSNTTQIPAGSVIDLESGVLSGVSLSFQNFTFNNNDGTNNWTGLATNGGGAPTEFVDSVTTDISGRGGGGTCVVVVSGLDPESSFEVTGVTAAILQRTDTITIVGDQTYGPSAVDRPTAVSSGAFHTFAAVKPDSAGTLTIELSESESGNPVLNGLLLTELGDEDTDNDGLPDDYELANFGDLDETAETDFDQDGLINGDELLAETDPTDTDSDDDSLLDGAEVNTHGTNPLLADTDGDTIDDFAEINEFGTNPNSVDSDGDELTDADELVNQNTNPNIADSDNDGASDGLEVVSGFNPNSSASTPPSDLALAGMTSPGVVGPLLDGSLPATTPVDSTGDSFERQTALPNVTFNQAMGIVTEPRSNHLVVIERDGRLQQVEYDPAAAAKIQILDISSQVETADWGD